MSILDVLLKIGLYILVGGYFIASVGLTLYVVKIIHMLLRDWSKNKNVKSMFTIIGVSLPIVAYCAFLFWLGIFMFQHI